MTKVPIQRSYTNTILLIILLVLLGILLFGHFFDPIWRAMTPAKVPAPR